MCLVEEEGQRIDMEIKTSSPEIDLKDYETTIVLRQMTMDDFDALIEMQAACFPGMEVWDREHIESQLKMFPEGQFCIEIDGKLAGSASGLIVDFSSYTEWHNWREISDDGYIRNHHPDGDTFYGIEMMVHPEFRGMKLSRRLYEKRKQVCREHNLNRIMIAGRIPGYGAVADEMTAREYVEEVMERSRLDPVLTPQLANGFVLKQLIPSYLDEDTASRGYATFLEWTNLDYVPESAATRTTKVELVRICSVQLNMKKIENFEEFAEQVEFFVDVASDYRCDFQLFPELMSLELLHLTKARQPGFAVRGLADYTPQILELFSDMAIRYDINIIGGSHFTLEEEGLFNISYLFRRDGTLGKQYKLHITPNERRWWGTLPGDTMEVFQTDRGKIAINLDYDVQFPELGRVAAARGARILFVPFSSDTRNGYLQVRTCAQARAIENGVYVAISGSVGNMPNAPNGDTHYAQSGIFTPVDISFSRDGIAGECTPNIETVIIQELDLTLLARHRATGTVQNWNDRRGDLYKVRYFDGGKVEDV